MKHFGTDKMGADCKDIRPHLKAIDPLFEIVFNFDFERYEVYFNGGLFKTVPWNQFDKTTVEGIRKAYWINVNGDVVKEIDEHNAKLDKSNEKNREDMTRELAKDLRKAFMKEGF